MDSKLISHIRKNALASLQKNCPALKDLDCLSLYSVTRKDDNSEPVFFNVGYPLWFHSDGFVYRFDIVGEIPYEEPFEVSSLNNCKDLNPDYDANFEKAARTAQDAAKQYRIERPDYSWPQWLFK
jgi:hypothetical protein